MNLIKEMNLRFSRHAFYKRYKLKDESELTPEICLLYCKSVICRPCPQLEYIIARDADCAIDYARHVLKDRFFQAEHMLSKRHDTAYEYALAIGKEFTEGVPAISESASVSYLYAKNVITVRS